MTFTWDRLLSGLKLVLIKYDPDLSRVGSKRLEYQDFEFIFYHLFAVIDPVDCRRKFYKFSPARNPEEQSRFYEYTIQFINQKHLLSTRVSVSQLRMCGGEPFRHLTGIIITQAAKSEITNLNRKYSLNLVFPDIWSTKDYFDAIIQKNKFIRERLASLQSELQDWIKSQEVIDEIREQHRDLLATVVNDIDVNGTYCVTSDKRRADWLMIAIARFQENFGRARQANHNIAQIPISTNETYNKSTVPYHKPQHDKRVSTDIVAICHTLSNMTQRDSSVRVKVSRAKRDLIEGLKKLYSKWKSDVEIANEALIDHPKIQPTYDLLENLYPLVHLEPVQLQENVTPPKISDISESLCKYCGTERDSDKVIPLLARHFSD